MNTVASIRTRSKPSAWAAATACVALAGCSAMSGAPDASSAAAPGAARAMAPLQARSGSTAGGSVWFDQQGSSVKVTARVTGLVPNREHGFHVHQIGDCSAPNAESAGAHFNPDGQPHGPQNGPHHAGDMPSLKADANGNAEATFKIEGVTVSNDAPGADGIVGRAVIVHVQPDDYKTQPSGNSAGRVACGVIAPVPGNGAAAAAKG